MINAPATDPEPRFPPIPKDLLDALDSLYPERSPDAGEDIKRIRHKAGQRSVVRFLKQKFEDQNTTVLPKS